MTTFNAAGSAYDLERSQPQHVRLAPQVKEDAMELIHPYAVGMRSALNIAVRPTSRTAPVANLFDKKYYASSCSQVWVAPGTNRTAILNAQYSF